MSGRKRKAEDDPPDSRFERMSFSPSPAPSSATVRQSATLSRQTKKAKTSLTGRCLPLPRLLETLSPGQLRHVLQSVCERHPHIGADIMTTAPRPNVDSVIGILESYETAVKQAFPFGDPPSSDYAFNRVRPLYMQLLDAFRDFTPRFLPPEESQPATSLAFLDRVTDLIHRLPNWDSYQHNRYKHEAYEDVAKAWAAVVREALKKAGGIGLQVHGWDQKLIKHDNMSGGKMSEALSELRSSLGWMDKPVTGFETDSAPDNIPSIREQLYSNTYGTTTPISVGPW